jgi:hypothetical protein
LASPWSVNIAEAMTKYEFGFKSALSPAYCITLILDYLFIVTWINDLQRIMI